MRSRPIAPLQARQGYVGLTFLHWIYPQSAKVYWDTAYAFADFSEEPEWLRCFRQSQKAQDPAISNKISVKVLQLGRHKTLFIKSIHTVQPIRNDFRCIDQASAYISEKLCSHGGAEVKVSRNAVPVKELLPVRRSGQNLQQVGVMTLTQQSRYLKLYQKQLLRLIS